MNTSEIRKENLINLYNDKGERHGYWERYYDNGQLMYKGNYVNGKQHGYWEKYFDNGQLCYKGNYVNGEEHGYWEEYYSNGNKFYVGYYDMGKEVDYNPDEQKLIELEKAREVLKRNGFFVDNLWHINDVKTIGENVGDEKAQRVLNIALTNEATIDQIWLAIKLGLEQD
jgi:hypothetical protein